MDKSKEIAVFKKSYKYVISYNKHKLHNSAYNDELQKHIDIVIAGLKSGYYLSNLDTTDLIKKLSLLVKTLLTISEERGLQLDFIKEPYLTY